MDSKGVVAIVLCGIGLALIMVSASSMWYTSKENFGKGFLTSDHELYLEKVTWYVTYTIGASTKTGDYASDYPNIGDAPSTAGVHANTKLMTWLSFALVIVAMILIALASIHKLKGGLVSILVILISLLIFLTPLLYYLALPTALRDDYSRHNLESPCPDFMISKSEIGGNYTASCGPANGWYLMFAAFVFVVFGGSVAGRIAPTSPAIATAPPIYYTQPQEYRP